MATVPFAGVSAMLTDETVTGTEVTVIGAEPDLVASFVDVAVQPAVPAAVGVNTPEEVIVPSVAA
jgi:hypothetical protein